MGLEPADWLLSREERGNPRTTLDDAHLDGVAWSTGNLVRPLVHGAPYFAELAAVVAATGPGDLIYFTDWRGDPDERLTGEEGSEVETLLSAADRRGVDVRGLVWRSHWDALSFSGRENRSLGERLQANGAEVLLDMRVRTGGSHHQKLVVVRHADRPADDVAYVGGIDLCHSRRDDAEHVGDPQPQPMAALYGPTPAWHDAQVAISGPGVHDVETVFRERWLDPTPLTRQPLHRLRDRLSGDDVTPDPLPAQAPPPPAVPGGTHVLQLLRTYPDLRHGRDHPFARGGERSVARGYSKALARTDELVYVEDQYLWSREVAQAFADALRRSPGLRVVVVLPQRPDQSSAVSRVPQELGRETAVRLMEEAGGDRVSFYGLENHAGTPVYVHAKICVMDDCWATVGSDNFNRRSWTHDSELSAVVVDTEGGDHSAYARRLRLTLAAEHLDRPVTAETLDAVMADCLSADGMAHTFAASAAALQAWHDDGERGPRPPGRLVPLPRPRIGRLTRLWAWPLYRVVHDPDGRPRALRRSGGF